MSDQPDLGDIHDSRDRCEGTIPRGRAVEAADPTAYFSLGKEIAVCRKGISGCLSEGSQHGPFRCWQMTIEIKGVLRTGYVQSLKKSNHSNREQKNRTTTLKKHCIVQPSTHCNPLNVSFASELALLTVDLASRSRRARVARTVSMTCCTEWPRRGAGPLCIDCSLECFQFQPWIGKNESVHFCKQVQKPESTREYALRLYKLPLYSIHPPIHPSLPTVPHLLSRPPNVTVFAWLPAGSFLP